MTPEYVAANLASWKEIEIRIGRFPGRFLAENIRFGMNRYFRAGMSMSNLIFSTLERHGLRVEPRVTTLAYTLPFDQALPSFSPLLNQLWTATMPEGIPADVRRPLKVLHAPPLS